MRKIRGEGLPTPLGVDTEDLSARLRVIASWAKVSARDIADALNVGHTTVRQYLVGTHAPPLDFLVSFCAFTGTRVVDVLPFVNDVLPFPGPTAALPGDVPARDQLGTFKVRVLNVDQDGFDGYAVVRDES